MIMYEPVIKLAYAFGKPSHLKPRSMMITFVDEFMRTEVVEIWDKS